MTTYSFVATSTTASGTTTLEASREFSSVESAQAYVVEWTTALNSVGYNGSKNWTVVVNGQLS